MPFNPPHPAGIQTNCLEMLEMERLEPPQNKSAGKGGGVEVGNGEGWEQFGFRFGISRKVFVISTFPSHGGWVSPAVSFLEQSEGFGVPPGEGVLPRWVQGTQQGPGCSAGDVVGDCMGWSPQEEAEQRAGDEGDMGVTPVTGLGADERPAADAGISGLAGRGGHGEPVTPVGMGKGTPAASLAAWGWFCCCVG